MRIAVLIEGATEKVFFQPLRDLLEKRGVARGTLALKPQLYNGRIPIGPRLKGSFAIFFATGSTM